MNFLGHAHVALWSNAEPAFVLGAMLPDFAGMAGTRLRPELAKLEGDLARGIALHHRTDDAFHGSSEFIALMQQTMEQLLAQGVARGTARAVGHIGVELLIDGELVHQHDLGEAYRGALDWATQLDHTAFHAPEGLGRFQLVRERLCAHGVPYDYRNTDAVATRLARILRDRPRLAMDEQAERIVRGVLRDVQGAVVTRLGPLLDDLSSRLLAA